MISPGIYRGIPATAYHNDPEYSGLSKSILHKMVQSPAHAYAAMTTPSIQTPAMAFGEAFHLYVLQPEIFSGHVVSWDGYKRGKAWDEFRADSAGKIVLSTEEMDALKAMRDSILSHRTAAGLIQKGVAEQSVFWDDEAGLRCKARPDYDLPKLSVLMDLKTCQDASPEGFARACVNFGYHIQAPWYLDGYNHATGKRYGSFIFLCVEKTPPYAVAVYRASQAFLEKGRELYMDLKHLFNECTKNGFWPGYPDKVMDLNLPAWAA